jgi:putative Holliday junction resolvase
MGRILALDPGEARMGVAISDEHRVLARGLTTLSGRARSQWIMRLKELVERFQVEEIVVGLPRNMNGSLGPRAQAALSFAEEVRSQLGIPVRTWDERLSTVSARRALIESGTRRSARSREALDRVSAAIILQGYLDSLSCERQRNISTRGD